MYASGEGVITAKHHSLGKFNLYCLPSPSPVNAQGEETDADSEGVFPDLLFTENNTNFARLYGGQNETPYVKDAFHDHIIPSHRPAENQDGFFSKIHSQTQSHRTTPSGGFSGDETETPPSEQEQGPRTPFPPTPDFVNPERVGTKSAAHYVFRDVPARGGCAVVRMKLTPRKPSEDPSVEDEGLFDDAVEERREEANEFYNGLVMGPISDDFRQIMRQAFAGMLWTKQFYQFIQKPWMEGDDKQPPPPPERKWIRNRVRCPPHFRCLRTRLSLMIRNGGTCTLRTSCPCLTSTWIFLDVLLPSPYSHMHRWEYPFFAAWDTAFHCIPLAVVDPSFAKKQLDLLTREWYMKPDGQIPAYEWNFGDVNPPVHAW